MEKSKASALFLAVSIILLIPALAFGDLTVSARRDNYYTGAQWGVVIRFNHPVFPSNLAESLNAAGDGAVLQLNILNAGSRDKAVEAAKVFLIVPVQPAEKASQVTLTVKKGLSDSTGRILLAKDFVHQFKSAQQITISGINSYYRSKNDKGLRLSTSDEVPIADFARIVSITPAVSDLKITRPNRWNFQITGSFEFGKDYSLNIPETTIDSGKAVIAAKNFSFKGPGLAPDVSFKSKRSVIELKGRQILPVTVSNMGKVRARLIRVPPYLLPEAATHISDNNSSKAAELVAKAAPTADINPEFAGPSTQDADVFFATDAVGNTKSFSMPLSFRKDADKGGIWIGSLSDPDSGFKGEASKIIQITDLAVSYKVSPNTLLLWVTSLYTGEPVANVELLLTQNDGSKYFVGKTDKDGIRFLKNGEKFRSISGNDAANMVEKPISIPDAAWIIAATPNDACAVELNQLRLTSSSVNQVKSRKEWPDSRTGSIFTERGVYKPGETVNFKFVSRAYKDNSVVAPVNDQVSIQIVGPREDVNYSKSFKLSEFGTCYDSFPVKSFFPVGTYEIKALGTREGKTDIFTTTFQVQEFKRIRHYASLSIKPDHKPDNSFVGLKRELDFLSVEVKGQYYTGGPVKNGRARWKATLVPVTNTVKGLNNYTFGNEDTATEFLESGESVLDKDGRLIFTLPLDTRMLTGIYGINISATVLDVDGEPATEVETYNPKPKLLVGIENHPKQVESGFSAPLNIIVVDQQGKKVESGTVEAAIMQQTYFYTQKRDEEGNVNYVSEYGWKKVISSQQQLAKGQAAFPLQLNDGGDYLVEVSFQDQSGTYAGRTMIKVGWRGYDEEERSRTEKTVKTSNEILLSMDKKEYKPGENVRVRFHTPRAVKKGLVALEKADVVQYAVVDVNGTDGQYDFTIKDDLFPNVFVSVMAPGDRSGFPVYATQADVNIPIIYYGYTDVSVRDGVGKLKLEIDPGVAELKGRPAEEKQIKFKVTNAKGSGVLAEMAVCVVDEAILALTRYQTPELSALANFNLPLSVFSGDLRQALVSQDLFRIFSTKPLTGGGMGLGDVNPSLRKDFRPVAYYNPALVTDESGNASIDFKLPDTTTAYRVFAVVCDKGSGFVSGQRNMVVTKEFFIEPSMPRFLIPGDKVVFPVIIHNKTKERGTVKLQVKGSKDLLVKLSKSDLELEPWASAVVTANAEVTGGLDKGTATFSGNFKSETESYSDAIEHSVVIHSKYLPVNFTKIGDFSTKADLPVHFPAQLKQLDPADVNPEDFQAILSLSTTNWPKLVPGLKYLLRYPYGCIEQTSSGVIPLAGLRGLVKQGMLPGIELGQVDKFLNGGINRLLSMQLASGAFSYWPGELDASWWGTLYAGFALISAKEAGMDVPEDRLQLALKYLKNQLFAGEGGEDVYHQAAWNKELALLNLASAKLISAQEMDAFMSKYETLTEEGKALLLLAAEKIGHPNRQKLVQLAARLDPKVDTGRTNYWDSTYRELAVCLIAAMETGHSPKADAWAGSLLRGLKSDGRWYSTADTGWALLALSKFYSKKPVSKGRPTTITVNYAGEKVEVQLGDISKEIELNPAKLLGSPSITLESNSKDLVTYTLSLRYPDVVYDPTKLSKGFLLDKTVRNLNGEEEIRVGDIVRVTLTIDLLDPEKRREEGYTVQYAALEDPVPAGIVPINSELKTEGQEKQANNDDEEQVPGGGLYSFTPTYLEIRDDGMRVFKNEIWTGHYTYSYLARAVAEGEFWMRGSRISLMYEPERFAKVLGKKVKIMPAQK